MPTVTQLVNSEARTKELLDISHAPHRNAGPHVLKTTKTNTRISTWLKRERLRYLEKRSWALFGSQGPPKREGVAVNSAERKNEALGKDFFFLIYLFMAVLGLCFCARAFSSCGKWGPLFIVVRGPLTIVASLVAEHRLQTRRLSSCTDHLSWNL